MFERLERSWELIKASAAVLRDDTELLIFPLLSAIGVAVVTVSLAVPLFATGVLQRLPERGGSASTGDSMLGLAVTFVFYLASYSVIFFCNSALVACALIRLRGGDPTVRDGLRAAMARLPQILSYALLAATVGIFLKYVVERVGFLGRIVINLLGAAWNIITFLTVPVLVNENLNAVDAVKRSAALLKQTWGEQALGALGIGLAYFWISLASSFFVVGGLIVVAMIGPAMMVVAFALIAVWFAMLALIHAALQGVYTAALYRYAAEGQVSAHFAPEQIQQAFAPRRR